MFFFSKTNINEAVQECRNTPDAVLLDVREADEFRSGHIPGAVNHPLSAIEKIEIPDGPEELCMTFCNCKALKEVKLPSTVKVVDRAFRDCTSLETVELPAGVETIAENSFAGCVVLKEVRFPKGAKVARGAFAGCPKTLKKKKY